MAGMFLLGEPDFLHQLLDIYLAFFGMVILFLAGGGRYVHVCGVLLFRPYDVYITHNSLLPIRLL